MSLHILAAVANGVLERIWPMKVPPNDYDLPVQDTELECWEPRRAFCGVVGCEFERRDGGCDILGCPGGQDFAGAAASLDEGCSSAFAHVPQEPSSREDKPPHTGAPHTAFSPSLVGDRPLSGGVDDTSAAGVDLPPTAPAALPTAEWLTPAVLEVLASHIPDSAYYDRSYVRCNCGWGPDFDRDWSDWHEHVAADLTPHVLKAIEGFQK